MGENRSRYNISSVSICVFFLLRLTADIVFPVKKISPGPSTPASGGPRQHGLNKADLSKFLSAWYYRHVR